VDLVIDPVGRQMLAEAWFCVKDDGALIIIFEPPEGMEKNGVNSFSSWSQRRPADGDFQTI